MSPKKSVRNQPAKKKIVKMPKRTVKNEKSKLNNMPATIQVSIPFTRKTMEGLERDAKDYPIFKKNLDLETKIELANEVVRKQLVKKESHPVITQVTSETDKQTPKRGRKKKNPVIPDFFKKQIVVKNNNKDMVITSTANPIQKKPPAPPTTRIVTRKRLADSTAQVQSEPPPKLQKLETSAEADCLNTKIKTEKCSNNETVALDSTPTNKSVLEPITTGRQSLVISHCETVVTQSQPDDTLKAATKRQPQVKRIQAPVTRQAPTRKKRAVTKGKKGNIVASDKPTQETKDITNREVQEVDTNKPGLVGSRKTSVSSNSNLSWTRDISSSSTATCITVNSNDFVRFNKKVPVIKLTHVDREVKRRLDDKQKAEEVNEICEVDESSSDSSSDSSSSSCENVCEQNDIIDVNSVNLSVSSFPTSVPQAPNNDDVNLDYAKAAEKLAASIKNIDEEIIIWLGSGLEDINGKFVEFKNKMFETLDNEFGIITHCRCLKELCDNRKTEQPKHDQEIAEKTVSDINVGKDCTEAPATKEIETQKQNPIVEENKDVEFVKPRPCRKLSVIPDINVSNVNQGAQNDSSDDEYPSALPYDHHDDDDALSLFAESITGIESSKMNYSIATAPSVRQTNEEYVPKPVNEGSLPNDKHAYCPTTITDTAEILASKINSVCEKQNADSTSIYKQSNSTEDAESYQDLNEQTEMDPSSVLTTVHPEMNKPRLMESFIEISPNAKNVAFGKVCYYNLLKCCRSAYNGQCRFPHIVPTPAHVTCTLSMLDERMLIQEYLLMRNRIQLRRKYGMCFAQEFEKRGLTRFLVEIAFDFIVKARSDCEEDARLRVNTIELTLLHLNNVNLNTCDDLLKLTVRYDQVNRTLLCDVFMATMSITQNFSRFKSVFLNLTYFMVDNYRTFNKDVVEHILERICILPFEEPIARALIQMMRLTKPEVFRNSMISHFEKQISASPELAEEFSLLKSQLELSELLASSVLERNDSPTDEVDDRADRTDGQPPAPSPDTTNLDNLNKKGDEPMRPVITRTIGMNPPIVFQRSDDTPGPSRIHDSSDSSHSDDTIKVNVRKWRNRSIFPHVTSKLVRNGIIRPPNPGTPMRSQMRCNQRPHQRSPFMHRLVVRSPINYKNRLPGPKY